MGGETHFYDNNGNLLETSIDNQRIFYQWNISHRSHALRGNAKENALRSGWMKIVSFPRFAWECQRERSAFWIEEDVIVKQSAEQENDSLIFYILFTFYEGEVLFDIFIVKPFLHPEHSVLFGIFRQSVGMLQSLAYST